MQQRGRSTAATPAGGAGRGADGQLSPRAHTEFVFSDRHFINPLCPSIVIRCLLVKQALVVMLFSSPLSALVNIFFSLHVFYNWTGNEARTIEVSTYTATRNCPIGCYHYVVYLALQVSFYVNSNVIVVWYSLPA